MFSPSERSHVRARLIAFAGSDRRVVGAALVGSAARDAEDDWSDVDLALQLEPGADESSVVADWTGMLESEFHLADTLDVHSGGVRYRVFLLGSTLQVDLSFWPHERFRATGPGFLVLFGSPNEATSRPPVDTEESIGRGWLSALHARSAVARGKLWQADLLLEELRTALVALTCARYRLDPWQGREVDRLPPEELSALARSRSPLIEPVPLEASRILLTQQLLDEVARHDAERYGRLREPLLQLIETVL